MKMPKRFRESDASPKQAIKKQAFLKEGEMQSRRILSFSSENIINILFEGANKRASKTGIPQDSGAVCVHRCSSKCYYCENVICLSSLGLCDVCSKEYCKNCLMIMNEERYNAVCYSCINTL